jgi:hypothetical protein
VEGLVDARLRRLVDEALVSEAGDAALDAVSHGLLAPADAAEVILGQVVRHR